MRDRYAEVKEGYHMNKRHWNTVDMAGDLPEPLIREWILDSYRLVVNSLPRAKRETLLRLLEEDKT